MVSMVIIVAGTDGQFGVVRPQKPSDIPGVWNRLLYPPIPD